MLFLKIVALHDATAVAFGEDVVFTMILPSLVDLIGVVNRSCCSLMLRTPCLDKFCQGTVVHLWEQMLWCGELLAMSGVRFL